MTTTINLHPSTLSAIAEEGTKDEAVKWLQKTWNELRQAERENADLRMQLAERSGQCEHVERENELLREVLVAGAEELAEHWDAHCDSEGYGPVNLERRMLECLAVSYPGYSVGAFVDLRAKLEAERDKYLKLSEAYEGCDLELKEAERDVIVLCLRLCMEPNDSHSPDTADVLNRWRKVWEAVAAGMTIDAATRQESSNG